MSPALLSALESALGLFVAMVLPPLGAALATGLLISVLQAATQIQDQTLPQGVKLIVVLSVFAALAGALFGPLLDFAREVYGGFHAMVS